MKKNIFTAFLFACLLGFAEKPLAQKLPLCETFKKVYNSEHNNFEEIMGRLINEKDGKYATTTELEGADNCYIEKSSYDVGWIADFGNYNSQPEAIQKIKSIQNNLRNCYSDLLFVEQKNLWSGTSYYNIIQNLDSGYLLFSGYLGIKLSDTKTFIPYIKMPGGIPATWYFNVTRNADTSTAFAQQLEKIISASKSDYKNIIGEKQERQGMSLSTYYNCAICINGTAGCDIEQGITGKKFECWLGENVDSTEAHKEIEMVSDYLWKTLGTDFVMAYIDNNNGYDFTLKSSIAQLPNYIELKRIEASTNKYHVVLTIRSVMQ